MKNNRTVIATCIVALFASSPVFAKELRHFHEDDWSKVTSYGKVLVSQDSADSWGAWTDFVEPAAGGPNISAVQLLRAGSGDSYRNTPGTLNPPITSSICDTADRCGYAIFQNTTERPRETFKKGGSKTETAVDGWYAANFALTLTPDNLNKVKVGSGWGSGDVSWRLSSVLATDQNPIHLDSGKAVPAYFSNWLYNDGIHHFDAESKSKIEAVSIEGYTHLIFFPYTQWQKAIDLADKDVVVGEFERKVSSYTEGKQFVGSDKTDGYYVAGIATPLVNLSSLQAGQVWAKYNGASYDGQNKNGKVEITVNFGQASWSGKWTNQAINFNASGQVNGASIAGAPTSSGVAGYVQGTFYGQNAGSIGGVSSVTRNLENQTALFLVNKTSSGTTNPSPK